jgi:hypothetical protein
MLWAFLRSLLPWGVDYVEPYWSNSLFAIGIRECAILLGLRSKGQWTDCQRALRIPENSDRQARLKMVSFCSDLSARNASLTLFGHCNCCCCPLATATHCPTLHSTIAKHPFPTIISLCRRLASLKDQNRTGTGTY